MAYIIAEIGVNHQGDMDTAKRLIEEAAWAGADAVKFQLYDAEKLEPPGERRDMLQRLQLSREQIFDLKITAKEFGLDFVCTPFDTGSLRYLDSIGVDYIKISSGDAANVAMLQASVLASAPSIISTGMLDEVETQEAGCYAHVLMHCTSSYPCPPQDANLMALLPMINEAYPLDVGLSDHTLSTTLPAVAVALGATFIEKHLTLDETAMGPDHRASLEPGEFKRMVQNIREVEVALGDGVKRPMPSEAATMKVRDERAKWRTR